MRSDGSPFSGCAGTQSIRLGGPERRRYYRPELDVLRLFAFFLVFMSHVAPGDEAFYAQAHIPQGVADLIIGASAGGAFGVDLFFALSSFLITTLLLREQKVYGAIDVSSFYVRRMLRIWPLYFAFLFVVAPFFHHIVPDDSLPLKYVLAFVFLSGNWACILWGYPHSVAGPLWSVSVEEQFYLSWPLILRRWINHLVIAAAALLLASFITRFWLVFQGAVHPQIWCNTLARLDPIACGALLAAGTERKEIRLAFGTRVVLLLSGCVVLAAAGHYGDFVGIRALVTFPAVTVACIALIVGTLGWQFTSRGGPILRALTYLGRISYGLYVFHLTFIELFAVQSAHSPVARVTRIAAALLATVATAAVSYHFFEKPFLRLKAKFTRIGSRSIC
jgi:peptidoglycan/LPS O-acetylase OafA/YrhL